MGGITHMVISIAGFAVLSALSIITNTLILMDSKNAPIEN
jgi:hypothetical protein